MQNSDVASALTACSWEIHAPSHLPVKLGDDLVTESASKIDPRKSLPVGAFGRLAAVLPDQGKYATGTARPQQPPAHS